jgi:endonuclease YncB( thermonuclease family)
LTTLPCLRHRGEESRHNAKPGTDAVSLNQKRRIFRPAGLPLRGAAVPSPGMVLAFIGGVLTLGCVVWMTLRPSQAPARLPAVGYLAADPSEVAVVDGATLRLHDRVVRLAGIEPPERGETCHRLDGAGFDCGVAAANTLAGMVRDYPVECTLRGHDAAGRPLATCTSHGTALNRALVEAGWARAEPAKSDMSGAETEARAARRGLWVDADR